MSPVWFFAFVGQAFAEGIHTGIPLETVDGWGSPSFQTSTMGWTTLFEEGLAWVVVTRTEEQAHLWVEALVEKQARRSPNPVEGLGDGAKFSPLQEAWADAGASQCGFCSPGFLMAADALLARNPDPSRDEIREALAGNLCRCTGYVKIVDAVERCAKESV